MVVTPSRIAFTSPPAPPAAPPLPPHRHTPRTKGLGAPCARTGDTAHVTEGRRVSRRHDFDDSGDRLTCGRSGTRRRVHSAQDRVAETVSQHEYRYSRFV